MLLVVLLAARTPAAAAAKTPPLECELRSLPSFIAQPAEAVPGFAKADDVADIVQVYCNDETYGEKTVTLEDSALEGLCHKNLRWTLPAPHAVKTSPRYETELDVDGNSTVVMFGEECSAGATKVVLKSPLTTKTLKTTFKVLKAKRSKAPDGIVADPSSGIEDTFRSGAATILEDTFPVQYAGEEVIFTSAQFNRRCLGGTTWFGGGSSSSGSEHAVVDRYGHAFAIASGEMCEPSEDDMESNLQGPPYEVFDTTFSVEPPRTAHG